MFAAMPVQGGGTQGALARHWAKCGTWVPWTACTLRLLHWGRLRTALATGCCAHAACRPDQCQAFASLPHACCPAAGNAIVNAAELASYDQVTPFLRR